MDRPDIKIIIGKTGSGKTVKALNLIKDCHRVVMFDTIGHDYRDGVVFYELAELKRFWLKMYRQSFRLIYRPTDELPEFQEVCDLVFKCGNLTFVVEELSLFASTQGTPFEFKRILKQGRHRDIHLIGISQRPYGIDRTITAMATDTFVFRTDEPRDVKYLCERLGDGIAEKLQQLQPYEYVKCIEGGDELIVGKDEYEAN